MVPAMLFKTSKNSQHGVTSGKSYEIKSKLACILDASEYTRLRMEESLPNCHMRTILQEKGTIHCNIVIWYIIYSYASSHEDSRSKGSSG